MSEEYPDSIKILMLNDAGFAPNALQIKYLKLVAFVKKISRPNLPPKSLRYMVEERIGNPDKIIEAREILKEIGEA